MSSCFRLHLVVKCQGVPINRKPSMPWEINSTLIYGTDVCFLKMREMSDGKNKITRSESSVTKAQHRTRRAKLQVIKKKMKIISSASHDFLLSLNYLCLVLHETPVMRKTKSSTYLSVSVRPQVRPVVHHTGSCYRLLQWAQLSFDRNS